jgi:hypothetical protein
MQEMLELTKSDDPQLLSQKLDNLFGGMTAAGSKSAGQM